MWPNGVVILIRACQVLTAERDWGRFHDPKSLILALVGEVGELADLSQWIPAEEARSVFARPERKRRARRRSATC